MRIMKVIILLLCLCLLTGCESSVPDSSLPPATDETTLVAELKMPDTMKDFVNNPNVQWMVGMLVVLEDSEMIQGLSAKSYEVFTDPGDLVRATITAQSGLDLTQHFDLMVFADGTPIEFTVDSETHSSFPMYLSLQKESIKIEFAREFALNLGRLDFVLSFAENPKADHHLATYTMWIKLDGDGRRPIALWPTVEQRAGLKGSYSGGSYDSWLWNEGVSPAATDNIGPRTITIQDGETVLLEAIASTPGLYRTVLVVDGIPIDFEVEGNTYSYLDWESTGRNMLQLPITLLASPPSGSIYTITTPLTTDDLAQRIVASGKVELVTDEEE